jgi:hypothetical protein
LYQRLTAWRIYPGIFAVPLDKIQTLAINSQYAIDGFADGQRKTGDVDNDLSQVDLQ